MKFLPFVCPTLTQQSPIYSNININKKNSSLKRSSILLNTISRRYYHFNYRSNRYAKIIICPDIFLPSRGITGLRLHSQPENFHQTEPFSLHSPHPSRQLLPGFRIRANLSSFLSSPSRFLFHSGAEVSRGEEGIGWIKGGKQCCGRHRFAAAVLTTHFRASSFRGMYFLRRYLQLLRAASPAPRFRNRFRPLDEEGGCLIAFLTLLILCVICCCGTNTFFFSKNKYVSLIRVDVVIFWIY